jgi:hypothetical protein
LKEFENNNMDIHLLDDVFGISRDVPLTYTQRENLDEEFVEGLSRKKHIVVYGSSKQGKTCLRKNHLNDEEYIIIHCTNKFNISELNALILKKAGFKITVSEKTTTSNKITGTASGGVKFIAKLEIEGGYEGQVAKEVDQQELELDLADVNDIIKALQSVHFSRIIFLDDFHYLQKEVQNDFAYALKSYFEHSKIIFVIVGVWLKENRLISINKDLGGRVTSINADKWSDEDLYNVIDKGCKLLNIKLEEDLIEEIINESYGNIYFVQEICHRICKEFRIKSTVLNDKEQYGYEEDGVYVFDDKDADTRFPVTKKFQVKAISKNIINEHSGSYNSFLRRFAASDDKTGYDLYRWIIYVLLNISSSILEIGLEVSKIHELILKKHPDGKNINAGIFDKALNSIDALQLGESVIEYDDTNSQLNILDKGFVIWLAHQNKNELLNILNLPID